MNRKSLCVLLGPTGIGKTARATEIAVHFGIPVISADSRQIYRGMPIGTAAPDETQLKTARHYFIAEKEITGQYSAGQFELDVLDLLDRLFKESDIALMTGGSMMYIDAVCNGMDAVPEIDPELRKHIADMYREEGLEKIKGLLKLLDEEHYFKVDLKNPKRVMHALEVCLQTGKTYSSIRSNSRKERNFDIIKIGLTLPREELYERINARVDKMIADGLEEEARNLYAHRHLNALNTVGYKEWFDFFDGKVESRDKVAELIKRNTRHYAKKQMTWFKKDESVKWFSPYQGTDIINYIEERTQWTRKAN